MHVYMRNIKYIHTYKHIYKHAYIKQKREGRKPGGSLLAMEKGTMERKRRAIRLKLINRYYM